MTIGRAIETLERRLEYLYTKLDALPAGEVSQFSYMTAEAEALAMALELMDVEKVRRHEYRAAKFAEREAADAV